MPVEVTANRGFIERIYAQAEVIQVSAFRLGRSTTSATKLAIN